MRFVIIFLNFVASCTVAKETGGKLTLSNLHVSGMSADSVSLEWLEETGRVVSTYTIYCDHCKTPYIRVDSSEVKREGKNRSYTIHNLKPSHKYSIKMQPKYNRLFLGKWSQIDIDRTEGKYVVNGAAHVLSKREVIV